MNQGAHIQPLPQTLGTTLRNRFTGVHLLGSSGRVHNTDAFQSGVNRFSNYLPLTESNCAIAPVQRFAASNEQRLNALNELQFLAEPRLLLGVRGGYGITRLLNGLNIQAICTALSSSNSMLCAHSDFTALQMALLAECLKHDRDIPQMLQGPMLCVDFGEQTLDNKMLHWFENAVNGFPESLNWHTEAALPHSLVEQGLLWGGNLSMLVSLLGTPYFPKVSKGLLFIEDVNEHPYRIERMLMQLLHAGVLQQQNALIVGACSDWKASPLDNGYDLNEALAYIQSQTQTPIIQGLPFGHIAEKASLPPGKIGQIGVERGEVLLSVVKTH
jgi:muramoyltetrapeptide carboxypeptidase